MSNYSDVSFSLDANGDTASPCSSESTEADSNREGDSATRPTGLCTLYVDFLIDLCTDSKEQQCCLNVLLGNKHSTIFFPKVGTHEEKNLCDFKLYNAESRRQVPCWELAFFVEKTSCSTGDPSSNFERRSSFVILVVARLHMGIFTINL